MICGGTFRDCFRVAVVVVLGTVGMVHVVLQNSSRTGLVDKLKGMCLLAAVVGY